MRPEALEVAACEMARGAGAILRQMFGTDLEIELKSGAIDFVTAADRASEAFISAFIERQFPKHGLVGEEGARRDGAPGAPLWIVDPLDGTTNFAHGIPMFAVSIAASVDGSVVASAVLDVMRGELFHASRGRGAFLGTSRLQVSKVAQLAEAVVCTGLPYDRRERVDFYLSHWKEMIMRTHGVRRCGAAALDLAWVAAGRFDAFWEFGLKVWDVAASSLLITEADGHVTGIDGAPLDIYGAQIAASNAALHQEFVGVLSAVGEK